MSEEVLQPQGDVVIPEGGNAATIAANLAAAAAGVAERGRSPSGATPAAAAAAATLHAIADTPARPQECLSQATAEPTEGMDAAQAPEAFTEPFAPLPPLSLGRGGRGRRLVKKADAQTTPLTPQQRLLLLDTWQRSGLPAGDFAALVGLSKHTLYAWKKKVEAEGPAGLMDKPKGSPAGSRLPEVTKRTILMLKQANPDWGCQRISDVLLRGPALPASAAAVAKVLHEAGYALEEVPTRPHPPREQRFERARPNTLWQTDLFTFILDHTS